METTKIDSSIKKIIMRTLKIPASKINCSATFYGDLMAESLDFIELIMAVEDEFNFEFDEQEIEEITTVQDLINCTHNHIIATSH